MKTLGKQKFINIILFALLAVRISISGVSVALILLPAGSDTHFLVEWFGYFAFQLFWKSSFVLLGLAIILQNELQKMNIDKTFIFIFLLSGVFISFVSLPVALFSSAMIVAITYFSLKPGRHAFAVSNVWTMCLIILSVFALAFQFLSQRNIVEISTKWSALILFPSRDITYVVYEEVLYRGLLWMFLKGLNWSDLKIVLFTSFLFWISHAEYALTNPLTFWVILPIFSLLLGFLVQRTKSITPSSFAHVLWNFMALLIK